MGSRYYLPHNLAISDKQRRKLDYLEGIREVSDILCLFDFCDDGMALNGISITTENIIFPLAIQDIGCGFQFIHTKKKKHEMKHLEYKIELLEQIALGKRRTVEYNSLSLEDIYNNPIRFFQNVKANTYNRVSTTSMDKNNVFPEIGQIIPGSHFLEFRAVDKIHNGTVAQKLNIEAGDVIIIIHSGNGGYVKNLLLKSIVKALKDLNLSMDEDNGYRIHLDYRSREGIDYINNVMYAVNIALFTRTLIARTLADEFGLDINFAFDTPHEFIKLDNSQNEVHIKHFKGTQEYTNVNGFDLAFMPFNIDVDSYLMYRTSDMKTINHGVAASDDAAESQIDNVITNLKTKPKSKFCDYSYVVDACVRDNICSPIISASPWISIKNTGR